MRPGSKLTKAEVEAELALARESLAEETSGRELAEKRLAEALERQAATSEILQVLSRSPTDVQPVFDAIARSAARLCDAVVGGVWLFDGAMLDVGAFHNVGGQEVMAFLAVFPMRPTPGGYISRAVIDGRLIHVEDAANDPGYGFSDLQRTVGYRTLLAVPMIRDGHPTGVIAVWRREVRPFSDSQIALLETFADQAVIAVENVRLFRETKEALEQQTATSEVLKAISRSTFVLDPILQTLIENATRLCGATRGHIFRYDGDVLRYAASYGATPDFVDWLERNPVRPGPGSIAGRAAAERRLVHVPDVLAEIGYEVLDLQRLQDYRAVLAVPMLREDVLLGVITILNTRPIAFTQNRIALVTSFADQAVIAIENTRLLAELRSRTDELARSVEELTALRDVGQAVSSSLDLERVLSTISARAVELSGAAGGLIYEYENTSREFHLRGSDRLDADFAQVLRAAPIRLGEGVAGRAAALRTPIQIADVLEDRTYDVDRIRTVFERRGFRSLLGVPLLVDQRILGCLVIWRREAGGFAPGVVNLLQAFATQSVLAIENARLYREIESKSQQLEAASRHKSEFLANMSHELRTPLNAIIGFSEVLTERMFGDLNEKQDEYLRDIYVSGQHLLSLINDILDLSKIEAGRMELELTDVDLPAAIDNTLTLVRERAGRRGIAVGRAIDARVGAIQADERKVKQVLLNLLSNALKFTPEGGRIDVHASVNEEFVKVSVADTGVGIALENQEAVFEEFRQVGTAAKKAEGTGLGLALSRRFVELHGGRIWVESQEGIGSTFTFTLPLTIAAR